ncbi:hypothetical protein EBAPG3_014305 [Nitrosospira lacus]|uniref:Uncharacterized protein n=1 Tax=Nitrosospira lacus TaxID=1288494 RepID=A0A1W6SSS8_9PROT|nr:hypothetical protein EBAPG3_014305 [Nitrosospira lacus]
MPPNEAPIGIFDSRVRGLSVLRSIRRELPPEHLSYVADSGNAPYGAMEQTCDSSCSRAALTCIMRLTNSNWLSNFLPA